MPKDLNSSVAGWLREQGYPLEMATAWAAKEHGFDVSQSDYYIDPDSSEAREIDVVASRRAFIPKYSIAYHLFIECKSGVSKPWLLFTTANEYHGAGGEFDAVKMSAITSAVICNQYADDLLFQFTIDRRFSNLFPRIDVAPDLGYGVSQAFTNGTDVPYKALMSSVKAAIYHVKQFGERFLTTPFEIAVPVIVIDAPLLSVSYSPGSPDLEIKEIDHGVLLWKHMVARRSRMGVYIVQGHALDRFLASCQTSADWWLEIPEQELEPIVKAREKSQ